jgi:hypothetical protein
MYYQERGVFDDPGNKKVVIPFLVIPLFLRSYLIPFSLDLFSYFANCFLFIPTIGLESLMRKFVEGIDRVMDMFYWFEDVNGECMLEKAAL